MIACVCLATSSQKTGRVSQNTDVASVGSDVLVFSSGAVSLPELIVLSPCSLQFALSLSKGPAEIEEQRRQSEVGTICETGG